MPSLARSSIVSHLSIVAPGFLAAYTRSPVRLPALERLISYARESARTTDCNALECWQSELLTELNVDDHADYASAPVTWLGSGTLLGSAGERAEGTWMHIDPVRMELSLDGLSLRIVAPWTSDELAVVDAVLRPHLKLAGAEFRIVEQRAFAFFERGIEVQTTNPSAASMQTLRETLPSGRDASEIRRLMTELQMLLHDNFTEPAGANGVWLWGAGSVQKEGVRDLPALWTNNAYARGIYRLHGRSARCAALPKSLADVEGAKAAASVVVLDPADVVDLDTRWFSGALHALERGRFDAVSISLDGRAITAYRSLWRRFFARSIPIEALA